MIQCVDHKGTQPHSVACDVVGLVGHHMDFLLRIVIDLPVKILFHEREILAITIHCTHYGKYQEENILFHHHCHQEFYKNNNFV